ncbi:GNAT family N-acetyltransferase [Reinekea sp.]|uniref:GNAT family N-acetyltransferase n=1 Tax=Reinekea sp. TaxID=1970455 RepID=UPI0039899906
MIPGYKISSANEDMDISVIHGYLSRSYWSKDIPLATVQTAMAHSLCFGVFTEAGQQVAFARLITDQATFAYLADVFVLEGHQGKGISKWLIQTILDDSRLQGLRRIILATRDAHSLYEQFGFKTLASPEKFMALHQPNIYKSV